MPLSAIAFLGQDIPLPLRFPTALPFREVDKKEMPWLANDIRYYGIEQVLGRGGRATAYRGFVATKDGAREPDSPDIVLKVPNLDQEVYVLDQIRTFLRRQRDECGREWQLTRERLRGCAFANPIFDFSVAAEVYYLGELLPLTVTAQRFLTDARSLDEYLLHIRQRQEPYKSQRGVPADNWTGMSDPQKWIALSRGIAAGLADIHLRRVVHGDIWPPNIFIKSDSDGVQPLPIFIDFGEAFPIEPQGDPQNRGIMPIARPSERMHKAS